MVTNRRTASKDGSDYYVSEEWAVKALLLHEKFSGQIWEPACGDGKISKILISNGYKVKSSDLNSFGYGASKVDFLNSSYRASNIVTNPPYSILNQFMCQGIKLSRRKLCLLIALARLSSRARYNLIYRKDPPSRVLVFCERTTMYPAGYISAGSGTTEYAWYVWDKEAPDYGKEGSTRVLWIPPGTKARFGG